MQLRAELIDHKETMAEDCKQVSFEFQSRVDGNNVEVPGLDLKMFEHPEKTKQRKTEYWNIPIMDDIHATVLSGDGENNLIDIGNQVASRVVVRVKLIDEQHVAILGILFKGLVATEELNLWLHHNIGKIITLRMELVQGELFDDKAAEVTDITPKGKRAKKAATA